MTDAGATMKLPAKYQEAELIKQSRAPLFVFEFERALFVFE